MKPKNWINFLSVGTVAFGTLASVTLAEGPADLEALAERARQAAADQEEIPEPAAPEPAKEAQDAPAERGKMAKGEKKERKPRPNPRGQGGPAKKAEIVPAEVVPKAAEPQAAVPKAEAQVDLAKRAESLGLLSKVSVRASGVSTLYGGARVWTEAQESQLGSLLVEVLAENDLDLNDPESPAAQVAPFLAEEFMVVVGEGTPQQAKNLAELGHWNDKFQIALLLQMYSAVMGEDGALQNLNQGSGPFDSLMEGFQKDPEFLLNLITSAEMPPLLLAARISDDDTRAMYGNGIEGGLEMALAMVGEDLPYLSTASFEAGGVRFSGLGIDGKGLIDSMQDDMDLREGLEQLMDPAAAQDFINTLKEKDLVLASGISDEAVYIYLGSRYADVPLVREGEASLAASEAFSFCDAYLDEALLTLTWISEDLLSASAKDQPGLGAYIDGVQMGLEGNSAFGDTKKLSRLLDKTAKIEKKLLAMDHYTATASLTYLRGDGLYSESFGGVVDGVYDWESPFTLGGDSGSPFMTAQWIESEEGNRVATDFLQTASEAAYEMALVMSKIPELEEDLKVFEEGFLLFDEKMKGDFLTFYKGLGTASEGVGLETLMEVDLRGTWPTVPGVPEAILEKGLLPRISIVSPVVDGEKLAQSWKQIEKAAAGLLKTAGELSGEEIPMQRPMSAQANELTTWFYPIPMQTDDFVPSVTLDDEVMVMGTSKKRAIELAKLAKQKPAEMTGVSVVVNFAPLQEYLASWVKLAEENPDELLKDEDLAEFFELYGERVMDAVDSLGELGSWTTHLRMEDGVLRTSSHLKTN